MRKTFIMALLVATVSMTVMGCKGNSDVTEEASEKVPEETVDITDDYSTNDAESDKTVADIFDEPGTNPITLYVSDWRMEDSENSQTASAVINLPNDWYICNVIRDGYQKKTAELASEVTPEGEYVKVSDAMFTDGVHYNGIETVNKLWDENDSGVRFSFEIKPAAAKSFSWMANNDNLKEYGDVTYTFSDADLRICKDLTDDGLGYLEVYVSNISGITVEEAEAYIDGIMKYIELQ